MLKLPRNNPNIENVTNLYPPCFCLFIFVLSEVSVVLYYIYIVSERPGFILPARHQIKNQKDLTEKYGKQVKIQIIVKESVYFQLASDSEHAMLLLFVGETFLSEATIIDKFWYHGLNAQSQTHSHCDAISKVLNVF